MSGKNGVRRPLVQVIILLILAGVAGSAIWSTLKEEKTIVVLNEKVPDFSLQTLENETITAKSLVGKPTVINFWGSFCGPCVNELPALQRFYEKNKATINVIGINLGEDPVDMKNFINRKDIGVTFPVLIDPYKTVARKNFSVLNYPTTVFLKADGTVFNIHEGELTEAQFDDIIKKMN